MRVMVFVKATQSSERGEMPSAEMLEAMGRFNEELAEAGIMVGGDGLKPSNQGKRIAFDGRSRIVIDGPFAETYEQLGGYFLVNANDLDEAIAIAERIPSARKGTVEIRPVVELPKLSQLHTNS